MRKIVLVIITSFIVKGLIAQVGIGTLTPNSNAILELNAANKGLLLPRVSDTNAIIGTRPPGLQIFSTSDNKLYIFQGSKWLQVNPGSGAYWDLGGNSGTSPFNNFIGNTDDVPLTFSINGQRAGRISNSTASITSFGYQALYNNSGAYNTAFGQQALFQNGFGNYNTAVGASVLGNNSSGSYNTGIGSSNLQGNISGNNNTAVGFGTLPYNTASNNTAMGAEAGYSITTGYSNTAIGVAALHNSYIGHNNIAIGDSAMYYLTNSNQKNTAMGSKALLNSSGSFNTALGSNTLSNSVNGNYNTAIGYSNNVNSISLSNTTTLGSFTRADISDAVIIGSINGINGGTADALVGIGTTYPFAKVHIKFNSYPTSSFLIEETEDDYTRMEFRNINANSFWQINAKPEPVTGNSRMEFWNNSSGAYSTPFVILGNGNATLVGTLTQNSDARLKRNITPVRNSLQKLIQLNGYNYYWKSDNSDHNMQSGVIAQEVKKFFPELVEENEQGILSVNYSGLIPIMIESIKEQQKQIDELKLLVKQILNK